MSTNFSLSYALVLLQIALGSAVAATPEDGTPFVCKTAYENRLKKIERRRPLAVLAGAGGAALGAAVAGSIRTYDGQTGQSLSGWKNGVEGVHFLAGLLLVPGGAALGYTSVDEALTDKTNQLLRALALLQAADYSYSDIVEARKALYQSEIRANRIRELSSVNEKRRANGQAPLQIDEWLAMYPSPEFSESMIQDLAIEQLIPESVREKTCVGISRGDCYERVRTQILGVRATKLLCEKKAAVLKDLLTIVFGPAAQ